MAAPHPIDEAIALIGKTLRRERGMRTYVFQNKPEMRQRKEKEIDDALAALQTIEEYWKKSQISLFPES